MLFTANVKKKGITEKNFTCDLNYIARAFKYRFCGKSWNNPVKPILEDLTRAALYLNRINVVELYLKLEADTEFSCTAHASVFNFWDTIQ